MAKGPSVIAARLLERQEVAGEYRRSLAVAGRGEGEGTEDPDQAAPKGLSTMMVDGSMTCSTSWSILPSSRSVGIGCGGIEVHGLLVSMG